MLNNPFETLKAYVDQPSGSYDVADVAAVASLMAEDFKSLGFNVTVTPGKESGPMLVCKLGHGPKQLMLMGHMDTVFPRDIYVPYQEKDDGTIMGSGITDMKGGIMVMLYAVKAALPYLDLDKYTLCAVVNPDEELGSPESHETILETAKQSFAALSFEPAGPTGRLTCARKGVTSVLISCKGIPGHSGAEYTKCASAIQALCAQITKLYALRDDEKEISFNAGFISGGTAENVVAPTAECKCEFRYFNQAYREPLMQKIREIIAEEPVPGAVTTATFGVYHPAIDLNEKSQELLDIAQNILAAQGRTMPHEKTGGAGDIAIAGQAGIGVLDGLGLIGAGCHTVKEYCVKESVMQQIALATEMLKALCGK